MTNKLRPPAVPLVTIDPYFSIWSNANQLHAAETIHWTGATHGMVGMAVIDGKAWRFMGGYDRRSDFKSLNAPAMQQTDITIKPLSSIYTFKAGGITLTVDFTTPLLLNDLDVMARPTSYITIKAFSNDKKNHSVAIYYDVTSELAVDVPIQEVVASRKQLQDGSQILQVGTEKQRVLKRKGDMIRIDWGYASLVLPNDTEAETAIGSVDIRDQFIETKMLPKTDDINFPRTVDDDMPILASVIDYGEVGIEGVSHYFMLAYDDVYSIQYFNDQLPGYWARNGQSFQEVVLKSIHEYAAIMEKCNRFNEAMIAEAEEAGGKKYADILSLSYRQAIAAHKLVEDKNGEILFLSKENNSNGCLATVDVSYPSMPLFLLYNPELVKGMLRPIFQYASSQAWPYDFAPHDLGRYPIADGQAYGMELKRQMPIEECGNMLIMTAAVCWIEESAKFASSYWRQLKKWANYLINYGMDPGNQLCTDDFGGHLAHNANLSIKAIIGIASYGYLARLMGDVKEGTTYLNKAKEMAVHWEAKAHDGDHYRLAFDAPGTWSLKYNLVWDKLFQLHLFSSEVKEKEIAWYLRKSNQYGTPLDNRKTYTKADWLVWAATLANEPSDFKQLITPIWDFLNETDSRVPFTDWYYTIDGKITGFKNRSVVGGLFIKLLADRMTEQT